MPGIICYGNRFVHAMSSITRRCVIGTYKRLPRGRHKPSNELTTFAERAYRWIHLNAQKVVVVAVLMVAVAAAAIGTFKYFEWRDARAAAALSAAELKSDPSSRSEALAAVARSFGTAPAGREAMALLGNAALMRGNLEEAIQWFTLLDERAGRYPMLRTYALHSLGSIYGRQGAWQRAADAFDRASRIRGNIARSASLYERARALENGGDYEAARAIHEQLINTDASADARIKTLSEERLLWLVAHHTEAR